LTDRELNRIAERGWPSRGLDITMERASSGNRMAAAITSACVHARSREADFVAAVIVDRQLRMTA